MQNLSTKLAALAAALLLSLWAARGLASDLIVSSDFSDSIKRFDLAGSYVGDFVPAGYGGLDSPQGVTVGPDGHVYVSSGQTSQVLRYHGQTGEFLGVFASQNLSVPWYLRFGPDGNLYVSSSGNSRVNCYDGTTGAFLRVAAIGSGLNGPDGLSFAADGTLQVSTFNGFSVVKRYNPQTGAFLGNLMTPGAGGLTGALEHRFSADGSKLFVSSFGDSTVKQFDVASGEFDQDFIAAGALSGPVGQIMHPDGSLLVSSYNNSRILRYDASSGAFREIFAQGGGLSGPNNIAFLVIPEPSGLAILATGTLLVRRRMRAATTRRAAGGSSDRRIPLAASGIR
jgi:sugar lactone lactonase YvrE